MFCDWIGMPVGTRVQIIRGKDQGKQGIVTDSFSVSGSFHIECNDGSKVEFLKPHQVKKMQVKKSRRRRGR